MENGHSTALVSLLKLRQMNPNESHGEGLRPPPANNCQPAAAAAPEDVLPGHYFPIQGLNLNHRRRRIWAALSDDRESC